MNNLWQTIAEVCVKLHPDRVSAIATGIDGLKNLDQLAAAAQSARGAVELVWSGPTTGIVPVRRTEQVVCEVIEAAFVRLFIVSFVAYKPDRIVVCLQAALARGVNVEILLEASNEQGGQLDFDSVALLRRELPTATFYTWKQEASPTEPVQKPGAVHAKCVVADGKAAFISSANLTGAAMDRNMELGILVRGGHIPEQLAEHLEALSHSEIVVPV